MVFDALELRRYHQPAALVDEPPFASLWHEGAREFFYPSGSDVDGRHALGEVPGSVVPRLDNDPTVSVAVAELPRRRVPERRQSVTEGPGPVPENRACCLSPFVDEASGLIRSGQGTTVVEIARLSESCWDDNRPA